MLYCSGAMLKSAILPLEPENIWGGGERESHGSQRQKRAGKRTGTVTSRPPVLAFLAGGVKHIRGTRYGCTARTTFPNSSESNLAGREKPSSTTVKLL